MSLKSLVQLFAEKFLTNKKEWVSHQSYCSNMSIELPIKYGSFSSYTAPADGILFVNGENTTAIDIINNDNLLRINMHREQPQIVAGFLPLSKGQTVGYVLIGEASQHDRVRFLPSIGSPS